MGNARCVTVCGHQRRSRRKCRDRPLEADDEHQYDSNELALHILELSLRDGSTQTHWRAEHQRENGQSALITELSGWYRPLSCSHRGPRWKKDDVLKTFHQGSFLLRFLD